MNQLVPVERIEQKILLIRGEKVMIDSDLAELYAVPTKALNQAVKRNQARFPADFTLQLNADEKRELVTNCDRFKNLKHSTSLPFAFTEHGALMLATVLNSQRAIEMSVYIIRAFIRLRKMLSSQKQFAQKFRELEQKIANHDGHIKTLFDAIHQLMKPSVSKTRKIGFISD